MSSGNGNRVKRQLTREVQPLSSGRGGTAVLEAESEPIEELLVTAAQEENTILNSLSELVVFQDLKHRVIWVNKAAAESVGKPVAELVGRYCYDLWGRGGRACTGCPIAKSQRTSQAQHGEVVTPDGKIWLIKGYPVRDTRGRVNGMVEIAMDISRKRRASDALQVEKNKLQSLVAAMDYGLTIQDKDFNIVYQNEVSRSAMDGDHVGKKCYRVYEGRDKVCDVCPVAEAFKDGKSHTAIKQNSLPSGEPVFWENTANPIRDAKGNIISCLEITRNITRRKQMENELQEEKNKLQSLLSAMEYTLTIQDKDFNIIYQNEASRKAVFGDRVGEKCYHVYENSDSICKDCPVAKAFKDGKSHTAERQRVEPSGEITYWENTANPIRDAEGNIVSCLELARDITERKRSEEALRESEGRYRAVIEGAHDMIQSVGIDGSINFVNQAWLDALGYTEDEVPNLNLFKNVVHPGYREHCLKMFEEVMQGKHFEGLEAVFLTKDGHQVLVEGNAAPRYIGSRVVTTQCVLRDVTERKRAESALADEATRRRILMDQSRDGIVILDQDGKVYEANQRFAEMLGYTPEEAAELHVWDWEAEFPRDRVADMLASVGPEGDHFETQHRRKDGSLYDVEISTNGVVYAEQKLIFCVCRDITERKQAENALVEAEEKHKNLVEATSDIIWEVDTKGVYTFMSPKVKDLLGYEVKEVVGKKRTLDFTPKKEARKWLKRFKKINSKREYFSGFEILHQHKDGTPVIFETSGIPLFDSDGEFRGYVGVNKDVTERKQVQEALRESQEFSTGLLENSPNPISVLNPDTSVRYVNPAFENLTGYKLAEIAGRKAPFPWWPEDQKDMLGSGLKNAMATGGKASEHVFSKKDGEPFCVALSSAPVMHRGKLLYFLLSWLDVTERKRAEEEKLELEQKAHLASRLASVGEMASGIAHEINNPLTAVIGFAQLLMDTDLPDSIKEDLVIIHKEAQRAAGVARNLLTFARKHAPAKQSTDINSIIEGVLSLRAYEQNVSNIEINTKLAEDLPEVLADYSQLQQVFINIILNAEAAMLEASNGGKLTITTQRFNHSVRASFADNGPGIDQENLDRIFDPFFTTKEVGKGTGLGLSVCHGIIAEHGGKIYARSKPGNGATFFVELPINVQEPVEEPNDAA